MWLTLSRKVSLGNCLVCYRLTTEGLASKIQIVVFPPCKSTTADWQPRHHQFFETYRSILLFRSRVPVHLAAGRLMSLLTQSWWIQTNNGMLLLFTFSAWLFHLFISYYILSLIEKMLRSFVTSSFLIRLPLFVPLPPLNISFQAPESWLSQSFSLPRL